MAAFRRNRVHFLFYAVGADDPVRPQETPVFTENRCEIATFSMGRCRHRPLRPTTQDFTILWADRVVRPYKRDMVDRAAHRFSYVEYWPPPRCFRRKKSSGFANAGRICEIYILRCRGRCPHRPARNDRFMAAFRRNRVHFLFYAVGADDPVRPQETPVFTEIRCESATFSMGRCRHRPLHPTTKIQRILRADRVVRPYK